jgi:AcrR family transcriptional regulator
LKSKRTGRRPGDGGTRQAILRTAATHFAERGFEDASIRGIARAAGVDPSLVVHYFGSKAGLFVAAFQWRFDPASRLPKVLARGRRHAGEELARLFLEVWDEQGRRHPVITLLRSATVEPAAAELMRDVLREQVLAPLMAELRADRPEERAALVASQLLGLALMRHVVCLEPLAGAERDAVAAAVGPALQRYLTGRLP